MSQERYERMLKVFGPLCVRYQRRAGKAEEWAYFTEDGQQITEFDNVFPTADKQDLTVWAQQRFDDHALAAVREKR